MTPIITPSNVTWLATCQKRFDRLAVKKQYPESKKVPSNVMPFSNACHRILRDLYNPTIPGPLPHTANFSACIQAAFAKEHFYKDETGREDDMKRANRLISHYLTQDQDASNTLGVEVAGNFPISNGGEEKFRLSARLDRIIVRPNNPNTLVVRDYKFAASLRPLDPLQVYVNLCVAKLLYRPAYTNYSLEVANISDSGIEIANYKSCDLKGIHSHIIDLVERHSTSTDHLPNPSDHCLFCPLLDECRDSFPVASLDDISFD